MSTKADRRQQAMKRDKRKKRIIAAVFIAGFLMIVTILVIGQIQQRGTRVFASANNTVVLRGDGTFTATLPHGVVRSGTFSEVSVNDIITVAFVESGRTVNGTIYGNVLTIPDEWDDGHGHPRNYILRS